MTAILTETRTIASYSVSRRALTQSLTDKIQATHPGLLAEGPAEVTSKAGAPAEKSPVPDEVATAVKSDIAAEKEVIKAPRGALEETQNQEFSTMDLAVAPPSVVATDMAVEKSSARAAAPARIPQATAREGPSIGRRKDGRVEIADQDPRPAVPSDVRSGGVKMRVAALEPALGNGGAGVGGQHQHRAFADGELGVDARQAALGEAL